MLDNLILITGHYGSGKTNLAVNLALDLRREGRDVAIADLDIVNPYFRTADFADLMEQNGVELLKSPFANSSLDVPSLNMALDAKMDAGGTFIIDVGGDDAGATALGRYSNRIKNHNYDMIYVVNKNRMQIQNPAEAALLLGEIEAASHLKATAIINNTHLAHETEPSIVLDSVEYANAVAEHCKLPLLYSTIRRDFYNDLENKEGFYPIDIHVDLPWYL